MPLRGRKGSHDLRDERDDLIDDEPLRAHQDDREIELLQVLLMAEVNVAGYEDVCDAGDGRAQGAVVLALETEVVPGVAEPPGARSIRPW